MIKPINKHCNQPLNRQRNKITNTYLQSMQMTNFYIKGNLFKVFEGSLKNVTKVIHAAYGSK